MSWDEVDLAKADNRHEIILTGADVSRRIEVAPENDGILSSGVFGLTQLNFLEISNTPLTTLSSELGNLVNLTNLVLRANHLEILPSSIGKLEKLKLLDISQNKFSTLPDEVGELQSLETLNASVNKLTEFPEVSTMKNLHIFDLSSNQLDGLPGGISCTTLALLSTINASNNKITEIPDDLSNLPSLKVLDLSNNLLENVPFELSECFKLKDLQLKGNKLKDRRLGKMVTQCKTKSILDYLSSTWQKDKAGGKGKMKKRNRKKSRSRSRCETGDEDLRRNLMSILKFEQDDGLYVQITQDVLNVRPYIVCCVIKNLNLKSSTNMFKRFINIQTKLHDGVCQKRQAATIATHDLSKIKRPLRYDARDPTTLMIVPLHKVKPVSAQKLFAKLRQEAEELRKEKKRNTLSGIHKYLDLLRGHQKYPCLVDSENTVISLPPITNGEMTKITEDTTDMLIEVTSSTSLNTCKKVMDDLLEGILELGVGVNEAGQDPPQNPTNIASADTNAEAADGADIAQALLQDQRLIIEQVKILDCDGGLKVLYPSKTDLMSEKYSVKRPK